MAIKQPANVLFANPTANLVTIDYNIGQLIGASNTVRTGAMNGRWPRQSQPRGICDISVGRLPLCHMAVFWGRRALDLTIQPWIQGLISIENSKYCQREHCIIDKNST